MSKHTLVKLSALSTLLAFHYSATAGVVPAGTASDPCTIDGGEGYSEEFGWYQLCKDGVSGAVTSVDHLRNTIPSLHKRVSGDDEQTSSLHTRTGLAAGAPLNNSNVWGNVSFSEFESTFIAAAYEADTTNILLGYDFMVGPRSVLGVAVGYEDLSTTTFYNGGGDDQNGFTIAPYYGVALTDRLTFDMTVGFASLDHEQTRVEPNPFIPPNILSASYDVTRYFGALNLSHIYSHENSTFSARVGYTFAQEEQDGYTEAGGGSARTVADRTIELSQLELGFDVERYINGYLPYASLTFRKDLDVDEDAAAGGLPGGSIVHASDDTEVEFVVGVDFTPQDDFTVSIESNSVFFREDFRKWGIGLSFRTPL